MSSEQPETRTKILKASLDLLEKSQGKGVRMTDIARRAGVSRQALYLHFATRADLLIATTLFLDDLKGSDERLMASRSAKSGLTRLNAFIEAWGGYIPEIYGVGKALMAMSETDEAAATAWDKRMQDMREGCEAAVSALEADRKLTSDLNSKRASDILWTMLSVRNWELLTQECGWSQEDYIHHLKTLAQKILIGN
jgi:AcrR family transcriptional regulator